DAELGGERQDLIDVLVVVVDRLDRGRPWGARVLDLPARLERDAAAHRTLERDELAALLDPLPATRGHRLEELANDVVARRADVGEHAQLLVLDADLEAVGGLVA